MAAGSLDSFLTLLFRPLARFCIRHGIGIQAAENSFRQALVEAGLEQMEESGLKVNVSRLCAMTGLYRHEIARRLNESSGDNTAELSITSKVVTQWESNARFRNSAGKPRVLTCKGNNSEFQRLVDMVSSHVGHAAVAVELERKGIAERTPRGLRLLKGGNVFRGDVRGTYHLVARDIDSLILAAEGNLSRGSGPGHIHVRTEFDNLYRSNLAEIQAWLVSEGKKFHKRARNFLARFDKDLSPRKSEDPAGAKVVLGTFSFSHVPLEESADNQASHKD